MQKTFERLFSPTALIKNEKILGDLPSTSVAFKTMYDIAWPCVMEAVLVALIASVDTMMVGNLGSQAIAAVGITSQPKFIMLAVILSLNVGITAVISRRKGENNQTEANSALKQCLIICTVLAFLMSIIFFIYSEEIIKLAGAGEDTIDKASEYFRIIIIGNFFQSIALTINAAQRGVGNTRISMVTNISANVVNLIFNFLLINGIWIFPRLETRGAAIATVLGNIIAFILSFISISKPTGFLYLFGKESFLLSKKTVSSVLSVSSSAMVEQVFLRVGFFVNTMVVANLGTTPLATFHICMNVLSISFCFSDGVSMASSSLVGQNLGAKRTDLALLYGKVGQILAISIGFVLLILLSLFRRELVMLFSDEADIIYTGTIIMFLSGVVSPIMASNAVYMGVLRGAGDVKYTAMQSLFSITILRPISTYIFSYPLGFGVIGAWLALLFDQSIRFFMVSSRFKSGKWTKIKL